MSRSFDAIVIGSGIGGLTSAALCSKAGLSVLVLERNDTFGGAASVYTHHGLAIEASLHEIDGFDEADPKLPLIHVLGLDHDLQFIDVGDLYEVRGGPIGAPFVLPHGAEAALRAAIARFPQHEAALVEYFRRLLALRGAVSLMAQHREEIVWWFLHAPEAARRLWPLLAEGHATLGGVLSELFGHDEAVKLALTANLGYYHDDPDSMLFILFAVPQASYLLGGGHYIRGGSQALTDRLVSIIKANGGIVETGRNATAISIEHGRVSGVGHSDRSGEDQRVDFAPTVLGNAAPAVLERMLPVALRSAFSARYEGRTPSISLWTLTLGLSRPATDFGVRQYSTFILPAWMTRLADMRQAPLITNEQEGNRMPPYVFVDYRQIDSGLNQEGTSVVTLCGADRLANWAPLDTEAKKDRKAAWIAALIGDLDGHFPGIANAVVYSEMATAETMHHYLNTPEGAVYGFAPEAARSKSMNAGARTAIDGLWLASAYTWGGGFTGAMVGGAAAAREAVRSS